MKVYAIRKSDVPGEPEGILQYNSLEDFKEFASREDCPNEYLENNIFVVGHEIRVSRKTETMFEHPRIRVSAGKKPKAGKRGPGRPKGSVNKKTAAAAAVTAAATATPAAKKVEQPVEEPTVGVKNLVGAPQSPPSPSPAPQNPPEPETNNESHDSWVGDEFHRRNDPDSEASEEPEEPKEEVISEGPVVW